MPLLDNAKHERFAQYLAKGVTATAAYVEAGYKEDRGAASRLSTNVNVQARVAELLTRSADRVEVTKARVLQELARIAFSDVKKMARWNESGASWKSSDEMSEDETRCIASIKQVMSDSGGTTELKLHNKEKALELIGKELGMFTGKEEPIPEDLRNMTTEQLIDALQRMQ